MISKPCIVLSGGGSRGAYEAGVISALQAYIEDVPVVGGTSTGALIATLIATRNYDLMRLIYNGGVKTENIVRPTVLPEILSNLTKIISEPLLWLAAAVVGDKMGIYSIDPLKKIINKEVDYDYVVKKCKTNMYYAAVEYTTLRPVYYNNYRKNANAKTLEKFLWASVSIPVFIEPVKIRSKYYVDGGLREFLPALYASKAPRFNECTSAILIDTNDPEDTIETEMPTNLPKMLLSTTGKLTDAFCFEQAKVAYEQLRDVAKFPVYRISPSEKIPISFSLNFDPEDMKKTYRLGVKDGKNFIKKVLAL